MEIIDFYNFIGTELSAAVIALNIILSFFLQLIVLWVYKKTHKGLSYSQSFLFTLVIIGVLGTVIMMVVQNNIIGAFALLGAFSLIRFRTIIKETRDVAFVFFSLALGVGVGTGNYSVAIITAILLPGIIILMWRYGIGVKPTGTALGYIMTITSNSDLDAQSLSLEISKVAKEAELLHAKFKGGQGHYAFSVHVSKEEDLHMLQSYVKKIPGVNDTELITTKHTVEY